MKLTELKELIKETVKEAYEIDEYDVDENNLHEVKSHLNDKFIYLDQIVRCMASNNYTFIFLANQEKFLISKSLKDVENILPATMFCRIHNSHLVNLKYIRKLIKGDINLLVMNDNTELEVSRRKKDELVRILNL